MTDSIELMAIWMAELEKLIAAGGIEWMEEIDHEDARFFIGKKDDWAILVVPFSIEDQGFPVGSRGYDGTATNRAEGVVMRLTRGQAEVLYSDAAGLRTPPGS
jgi:hypothetical protein